MTRESSVLTVLAAFLAVAVAEPASAQLSSGKRSPASGSKADLPRDLRQVRLVTRPQEHGERGRRSEPGRRGWQFGRQHHGLGLFVPTILVGIHVNASERDADIHAGTPPESKIIDVAAVIRSQAGPLASSRSSAAGDSTYSSGAPRVESVAWLEGCWEASSPQRTVEERWTPPRAGSMLGTSRTTRNGTLLEHEFITLREVGDALAYQAQPSGQPAAEFRSTHATDSTIVFENPQHDFPRLIGYRRGAADSLHAWIEGPGRSGPRRVDFAYRRVACEP
ncbi:MAG TPA: DUF6265 family protein [Gemmatimonadaceae bacterium]|nr:DUF6265 family protein [Gemmatimonadaceae bacterium]